MEFKHPEGKQMVAYLPPRSLLIMGGDSRYGVANDRTINSPGLNYSPHSRLLWCHGITPRKTDLINGKKVPRTRRISFTFRAVRPTNLPCTCSYFAQCDRWRETSKEAGTSKIEEQFVTNVYDAIAEHFDTTRHSPWPRVKQFLESLPPGSIVFDIGMWFLIMEQFQSKVILNV